MRTSSQGWLRGKERYLFPCGLECTGMWKIRCCDQTTHLRTEPLGCSTHAHMSALGTVPIARPKLGTMASDPLDWQREGKSTGWRRAHPPTLWLPTRARASLPETSPNQLVTVACGEGELGVPVPASPPPSSWLQEQRLPLSRLSLENSASRSPAPAHMSPLPLLMSLVKDGLEQEQHFDPQYESYFFTC